MRNKLNYLNNLEDIRLTKEFIFLNPYRFIVWFIYLIIFLIVAACIWLSFTNKQETIDVQGSLVRSDKVQEVQVLIDGVVDKVYAKEGAYVEKGDKIISLRSDKLALQKEELTKKTEEVQEQLTYLTQLQQCFINRKNTFQNDEKQGYYYAQVENYLSQIRSLEASTSSVEADAFTSQKNNLQDLLNAITKNTGLASSHTYYSQMQLYQMKMNEYQSKLDQLKSLIQAEGNPIITAQYQQQIDALNVEKNNFTQQKQLEVQQQIDVIDAKVNQAQSVLKDSRKKVENEIEKLKASAIVEVKNKEQELKTSIQEYQASLDSINIDLNSYHLVAKESGYITYKNKMKEGEVLPTGTSIGSLTSTKGNKENFEVTLNVPSSGIGFIKKGQSIHISVDGIKRKDYGYIQGTVTKIYESPIQTNEGVYYKVTASIDGKQNDSIYNKIFDLKDHMNVQASLITKETSWLTYLLQKMNIFKDASKT